MSIFGRLQYDSANTENVVTSLSNNVIYTMNSMPALLNTWQTEDVSNSNVGGYYKNPVANSTQSIWSVANSIIAITGLSLALPNVSLSANNLYTSANNFYAHTNRMSGVTNSMTYLPDYGRAMSVGKMIMMITFKSDDVQNNSPIMGNFTSLIIDNDLSLSYNTISTYSNTIANSIVVSSDGGDPPVITYSSNLTSNQITTIVNNLNSTINLMDSRRNGDVNFYNNSRAIIDDYNTVDKFSNPGQTEMYLFNNYIGTDKLKERINS